MEFYSEEELNYIDLILLSKIEEHARYEEKTGKHSKLDFEINVDAIHDLPEMAVIEVLKEIIKDNAEDLYPSIPTVVYSPLSVVRARLKDIVNNEEFMDKMNYAIEEREEAIKSKSK